MVSYAESSDEEDAPFIYGNPSRAQRRGRQLAVVKDEDDYEAPEEDKEVQDEEEDGMYCSICGKGGCR